MTDFPFGYFTNEMRTTNAGYHVVGQLGLFEDAVFTSDDGLSWERFPIEVPGTATALQIDHFHRTESAAAMAGSLGWADDLERTELTMIWWDEQGTATVVPPRPCEEAIPCSVTSLVAVSNGVVVTHQVGGKTVLSRWTSANGWRATADPEAELAKYPAFQNARLQSQRPDQIVVLGLPQFIESFNGGLTWDIERDGPQGVTGFFVAASSNGDSAMFLSADGEDAWVLHEGIWSRFSLATVELGVPLAIADGVALFGGRAGSGSGVIRFAPAGAS